MVFEHLFPDSLLEKKHWSAFVLAVIYSTISILMARLLFPANSGIVSVVFVSIFLIPYFSKMLRREEKQEVSDSKKTFVGMFQDNWDIIRTYVFIFFGIYTAYLLYSFLAPFLGYDVSSVFREQLSLEVVRGGAVFSVDTLWNIFMNNWWVLLACFLVALIAGDGAIFFIAWNASTWGTIFGYRAVTASAVDGSSALVTLAVIVLITLPHVFLESLAYILAAISGGVISDEVVESAKEVPVFVLYLLAAIMVYVIAYIALSLIMSGAFFGILMILMALGLLYWLQFLFKKRHAKVYSYNVELFLVAIGIFILGAIIETLVLYNATPLQRIYEAAAMFM